MNLIENAPAVTLETRLKYGYVTVKELCALKLCGLTTIYADIKSGALEVEKHGRSTRIRGPVAVAYTPGARHRQGMAEQSK
ncbi:hypothetical protein A1351_22785 [Methylosinus sp. R-45379]|uniref:hypothetical protein n=1 Tax=Methylosinus sp. R-45379 TaxID=980563 RepID=UPI0007C8A8F0|nr:hypothetical protein [Methylosinus sp. R-45379]OAI30521.1 hypothetical protein A1351_22785 [Methylosinus sp. R-45379]